jgi:hypothetical protein
MYKENEMKKFIIYTSSILLIFLTCCTSCGGISPKPTAVDSGETVVEVIVVTDAGEPVVDAAPGPNVNAKCIPMCKNIIKLGCVSSNGNCGKNEICGDNDDLNCYDSCTLIQSQLEDLGATLPFDCITKATTCTQVDNC